MSQFIPTIPGAQSALNEQRRIDELIQVLLSMGYSDQEIQTTIQDTSTRLSTVQRLERLALHKKKEDINTGQSP